ncbi:MAG: hypothetical protein AAGG68_12725 [Bacteroidota bacterium]
MKGLSYVVGQNGENIALQIDLKNHDQQLSEYIEDLLDLLEIEARKGEGTISWEQAKQELDEKGLK